MRKLSLVLLGCILATDAIGQDSKSLIAKWRACADVAAARYAQSTESAPVAARLAALSCNAEKRKAQEAVSNEDGGRFADEFVETVERRYVDHLSVQIMEMRLGKK
jgi:hypothetical protein